MNNWVLKENGGLLTQLSFADDPLKMNWISAGHPWGATSSPEGIVCHSSRCILPEDILEETYTFVNTTAEPIDCLEGSIAVELPLNDNSWRCTRKTEHTPPPPVLISPQSTYGKRSRTICGKNSAVRTGSNLIRNAEAAVLSNMRYGDGLSCTSCFPWHLHGARGWLSI